MNSSMLNLDQSPEELNEVYRTDYYWYLKSPEFREAFLKPLGEIVNRLGGNCLDVGCGEGWLADYVTVPYVGFDASEAAIAKARANHPDQLFYVRRLEDSKYFGGFFRTVVLGNILWLLIKRECLVELLLEARRKWRPDHVIVYDLEPLDTSAIDRRFQLIEEYHASVELEGIDEIKQHRKILVYQV